MKTKRHRKILEIIKENIVGTQEELAELLKQDGFNVTQATVSRDIKELALIKISDAMIATVIHCLRRLPYRRRGCGLC